MKRGEIPLATWQKARLLLPEGYVALLSPVSNDRSSRYLIIKPSARAAEPEGGLSVIHELDYNLAVGVDGDYDVEVSEAPNRPGKWIGECVCPGFWGHRYCKHAALAIILHKLRLLDNEAARDGSDHVAWWWHSGLMLSLSKGARNPPFPEDIATALFALQTPLWGIRYRVGFPERPLASTSTVELNVSMLNFLPEIVIRKVIATNK